MVAGGWTVGSMTAAAETPVSTDGPGGAGADRGPGSAWSPAPGYLNASTLGLPPASTATALHRAVDEWQAGSACAVRYGDAVTASRSLYARLVGARPADVAVGSQVSVMVGVVAASVPDGASVLTVAGEFTSVTAPFQAHADRGVTVRAVPLADLAAEVLRGADVVAFSVAQSATGELVDADAVAAAAAEVGALTVCDTTQAVGWLPVDATRWDVTVCAAYKWLCSPRGSAFLTVRPDVLPRLRATASGWYAGQDVWASVYGLDVDLAVDARRLDVSPAWLAWVGTETSLAAVEAVPEPVRRAHGAGLADAFRAAVGQEPTGRPVVALPDPDGRLQHGLTETGCVVAARAGRVRIAFHLWNDEADVDLAVRAVRGA